MGIRTFTFNGESSGTYGILITQNASFNAPERAGEMLSIPGRNGAFWQDYGRFENIEVTYHCAVGEGSKADFVQAMSDVRSWLCSPIGYCRLEDDYNPNEYRMAVYKSGLETDEPFLTGAEFDIVFECKPQRFLKSGETAVSVTSGNTITNPTRFDSKPQLQFHGYGTISINDSEIVIDNVPLGNIKLCDPLSGYGTFSQYLLGYTRLLSGNVITVSGKTATAGIYAGSGFSNITSASVTATTNCSATVTFTTNEVNVDIKAEDITFAYGTSSTVTLTATISWKEGGNTHTDVVTLTTQYNGVGTVSHSWSISGTSLVSQSCTTFAPTIYGYSTKTISTDIYIDLEIGEAWTESSGEITLLNSAVQFPAELPTLRSGSNEIIYTGTLSQFEVVPRWWKV